MQTLRTPTRRRQHTIGLLLTFFLMVSVLVVVGDAPASGTAPGANGKIAYTRGGAIWTMNANGSGQTQTTGIMVAGSFHEPTWSPDGTKIAFRNDPLLPSGATDDIEIMNANGTGVINLTQTVGIDESDPTWSPDGTKIAYVRGNAIWTMDANGAHQKALTVPALLTTHRDPAWSPDGTKIAFRSQPSLSKAHSEILVIGASGTRVFNLTNTSTISESDPTWAPNGKQIAYTRDDAIWSMASDGAHQKALTSPAVSDDAEPAWSPDGTRIAFRRHYGFGGEDNILTMNSDGTDQVDITLTTGNHEFEPSWQPLNRPPVAVGDSYAAFRDLGTSESAPGVLGNDNDPDGDTLMVANPAGVVAAHGIVTMGADGSFSYDPDQGFVGTDGFTYRATDGMAVSNAVHVTLTVQPIPLVGLVDPATGEWHLGHGLMPTANFYYGNPGDYPFMGDWDCDDVDTPGLYRQSDGYVYLRNSNTQGTADITFFFGNPGDVPIAGDFNNDGCDTVGIYRPSNQRFYVINALGTSDGGLGAADYDFGFGNPGDKPVVGDWDGDGVDEIGLHRESTGFFYYRNTLTTGVADGQFYFGDPGDRFIAGDWDSIGGTETPALFRPSDTTLYFRYTMTQGNADDMLVWTGAGASWLPVAGDFGFIFSP